MGSESPAWGAGLQPAPPRIPTCPARPNPEAVGTPGGDSRNCRTPKSKQPPKLGGVGGQRWTWGARVCDPPACGVGLSPHKKTLHPVRPRAAAVGLAPGPGRGPHSLRQGQVMGQGLEGTRAGQLTRLCAEAGTWTTVLTQLTWVRYWLLGNRGPPGHPGDRVGMPGSPQPLLRVWAHLAGLPGTACRAG